MPILLWPFPSGGIAPPPVPFFRRAPTGKVFLIHSDTKDFFGPPPVVNESCALVFYPVSTGPPSGAPLFFVLTDPYGTSHLGDPNFAFISGVSISEHFPISNIPKGSAVFTFGVGELNVPGPWLVQVQTGGYNSSIATFPVTLQPENLL
jgi:hypothetical protein